MSDAPFEAPSIESISALFPAYDFEVLIAQGGMGAVYKARQRSLDRDVAIKILPRELGDDTSFRTSFVAEAKAMARLLHPNLITVYDSGDIDGLLYIVMEYVPGKSLYYSAHGKAVDSKQAADIVMGICDGLAEAHESGIVHRDIKPANILLTPKRVPKIGDFGLARAAGHDSDGLAMGTPGYAAPEVIHQPELADQRSDIFAVGVILHELLTGKPPTDPFEPSSEIADSKLLEICKKATHADPSLRYENAEAMKRDLKAWARPPAVSPQSRVVPPTQTLVDTSASSSLGRNLAIIVVLLVAIFLAWKGLEKKKAATALAKKEAMEEQAAAKKPDTKPKEPAPAPPLSKPSDDVATTPAPVVPEVIPETPAESLIRLRDALAAGDFNELPVGTLTKGNSYYFHVTKPVTWADASRMARAYGGHLPLVEDDAILTWMAESIPADASTWIGTTRNSADQWQLVSGKPWLLESSPAGSGDFAAIDSSGKITANPNSASHSFLIQWHRDGSNPTDIKEILAQCGKTQESSTPVFPPGTEELGERFFLIIDEPASYAEALELAQLGGGELMTAASEEEAAWLEKQTQETEAPKGLWLGATLQENNLWAWNSFEPWTFARWAPASKPGTGDALVMLPAKGWGRLDKNDQASGFIVEWSDDHQGSEAPASPDPLGDLTDKAKELLSAHDAKRRKDSAKNATDYIFKLEVWLKQRGNNTLIAAWTPRIEAVIGAVQNGRLPDDIPSESNEAYPPPILEIAGFHVTKQKAFDLDFTLKAETLRDAYIKRVEEAAAEAKDLGQAEKAQKLTDEIAASADIETWLESLGFSAD